jgi:hypothetical protein
MSLYLYLRIDDTASLESIVTAGAGAGVLSV